MTENAVSPQSTKFDIGEADFQLFAVLWNQRMNLRTPDIHLKIARWLEWNWKQGGSSKEALNAINKDLLLMAFRSAGKSTIVGIFCAWLLYRNPDLRIIVMAADLQLAKKMVRNVKRIIERHPLTSNMKPNKPDQWGSESFRVKRMLETRDPSMMAKGISANVTGSRADIIIYDDVEVPNTCDSAEKRADLRERLAEMNYVLAEGGRQLYVGTPHSYYTIYADKPRLEIGEDKEFLDGFTRLEIPILDKAGNSNWIERYSEQDIARMRRASGPNKFASQMMLKPVNIAEGRLNPKLLNVYKHDLAYAKELQTLFIGKTKMVSASAFWDPAFGSAKGDNSVMAVLFADADGNFYLHHVAYIKNKSDETNGVDEATYQCARVAQIAKEHFLPSMGVEINGIGKFLPSILRNAMSKAKAPCKVQELSQTRNKDIRILEAFDAVLAARRLYVHASVLETPFMMEMQEWRPKGSGAASKGHDDGLDAVASALAQQPDRLPRVHGRGNHNWMRHGASHKAGTEFKI